MSLFSRKVTKEEASSGTHSSVLVLTRGHIDELVMALVTRANDKDSKAAEAIQEALVDVGRHQPDLVCSSCHEHLRNAKVAEPLRITLLHVIGRVVSLRRDQLSETVAQGIISLSLADMLRSKEVKADWQMAASNNLVTLGQRFPDTVLDALFERFPPGAVPHYFVVKTLGSLMQQHPLPTVPKLKTVLARVLPILGSINKEAMQWVFATALGQFCDAIIHYVANAGEDNPENISLETFASDMFPAYEILASKWLRARDMKVILAAIHTIGYIMAILPTSRFEQTVPRVIPIVLKLYSKHRGGQAYQITQGLFQIVNKAHKDESYCLQPLLTQILDVIHPLVCAPIDTSDSFSIKNHNEMLRCIEYLTRSYIDTVLGYLLQKLDPTKKENTVHLRVGTLEIFKHLITRMADGLNERKSLFVAGIRPLLKSETHNTVKKYMTQVIIAMAQHDYLSLEGGEEIIEWVALNASLTDAQCDEWEAAERVKQAKGKGHKGERVSPRELRRTCCDLLQLATSTIPSMENVLWPFMLELVIPQQYTGAISTTARVLHILAKKKREANDSEYEIDWERAVNLPKPYEVITRFMVLLSDPHATDKQGVNILMALRELGPILHAAVTPMWDAALPKLASYLEDADKFVLETWEDLVLRLVSETVKLVNDPSWTRNIGLAYSDQISSYEGTPGLKRCCQKHLGLVLQKMAEKRFIREKLGILFDNTNHSERLEREGCAQAFGYCSTTHLDITVDQLVAKLKEGPQQPEKKGFLGGLFSSKPKVDLNRRNTIYLCFGYVAAYAPVHLIPSRVEVTILTPLKPLWAAAKDTESIFTVLKCIDLIGKALHPSRLENPYVLGSRDELLGMILDYIAPVKRTKKGTTPDKEGMKRVTNELRAAGLVSLATLTLLPPRIALQTQEMLISRTVHFMDLKVTPPSTQKKKGAPAQATVEEQEAQLKEIFSKFGVMYAAMMFMNTTVEALTTLMKALEEYTSSADADHRERSCRLMLFILVKFVEYKGTQEGRELPEEPADRLTSLGHLIGLMIPRLCDPELAVRRAAVEVIEQLLFVNHILHVSFQDKSMAIEDIEQPDELLPLIDIRDRIDTSVLNEQFQLVHDVATVLCKMIPRADLPDLILASLDGLQDAELNSAAGVCVYLNTLTQTRGSELGDAIPELVAGMTEALSKITHPKTLNGTLHALKNLATHHLVAVLDNLLEHTELPLPDYIVRAFQGIAKDGALVVGMINHLCDILNTSVVYKEQGNSKVSAPSAMAATCALAAVLGEPATAEVLKARYAQVVGTLLLRVGTSNGQVEGEGKGSKTSRASEFTVEAIKAFVALGKEEEVQKELDLVDGWSALASEEQYYTGVTAVTRGMCLGHPGVMEQMYRFLLPFLQGNYEGHRSVTAAVYAEMINHCNDKAVLLQNLINTLLNSLTDPVVKIMCIRGFGNIVSAGPEMVNKYSQTILDALLSSIDSPEEVVALEAMNGLAKVFELVEEARVSPILVNLCNRIKPSMESQNPGMRAAAFNLFGSLWHFGQGVAADVFYTQIHQNFPLLVLHVNDEAPEVQASCKKALRSLGQLLRAPDLNALFQSPNLDPSRMLRYEQFLDEVSRLCVQYFADRMNFLVMSCVTQFKSQWAWQRANAVEWVGFLLGNLPVEDRKKSNLNPGMVASSLINMLSDKESSVRKATANAIALLHSY